MDKLPIVRLLGSSLLRERRAASRTSASSPRPSRLRLSTRHSHQTRAWRYAGAVRPVGGAAYLGVKSQSRRSPLAIGCCEELAFVVTRVARPWPRGALVESRVCFGFSLVLLELARCAASVGMELDQTKTIH